MVKGLVIGKFYPLHQGHIGLIEFARNKCDQLIVLVCASDKESIDGEKRLEWLRETFSGNPKVEPVLLNYSEEELPNTSVSSRAVSEVWATKIAEVIGQVDVVFSSEKYGDYLAEYLNSKHLSYEPERNTNNISASEIREFPLRYWDFIAEAAKPFFVKKICVYGTESTGKSTLTKRLAQYFDAGYVPEMAREIIEETEACAENHLQEIAILQAKSIKQKIQKANRFLFVDTDLNITRSYAKFLFGKELVVEKWIEKLNHFDLYLFLDKDAPFIQDGTRLQEKRRNELEDSHKRELISRGIPFELVKGNWEDRFVKSISIIEKAFI